MSPRTEASSPAPPNPDAPADSTDAADTVASSADAELASGVPASGRFLADQLAQTREQLDQLISECVTRAERATSAASTWHSLHIVLGLPAVILAAVAGAGGLASESWRITAAVLALVAGVLGGAAGFLRAADRQAHKLDQMARWRELETRARLARTREAYADGDTLHATLGGLLGQRNTLLTSYYYAPGRRRETT